MNIGILKESGNEHRVALLPDEVASLIKLNATVTVESKAGEYSFISDENYKKAGAKIADRSSVFQDADMVIGINAPSSEDLPKLASAAYEFHPQSLLLPFEVEGLLGPRIL